jgi:23S rRNA-/tRNA-specific pseudouridylate synthase
VTSGLLIFAKKKSTLKQLNQWFADREIQKTYLAITSTPPKPRKRHPRTPPFHSIKPQRKRWYTTTLKAAPNPPACTTEP